MGATGTCPSDMRRPRPTSFSVIGTVEEVQGHAQQVTLAIARHLAKIARMSMTRVMATLLAATFVLSCNLTTPKFAITHAEKRGRLTSNGLRFVIMPDANTQLLEVDVRYEVGSREDPPGKAGLAHLAEHLMFQQKPDGPNTKPLFNYLLQTSIFVNAYTNFD